MLLASVGAIAALSAIVSDDDGPGDGGYSTPAISEDPTLPRTVLTYFYYWYDLPDGTHSTELTDSPAEADASYESIDWFSKQLRDMEYAGIDVALAVYWGDGEPSSDIGLANLSRAAEELRLAEQDVPGIGMFLDTGLIGHWPTAWRDLTDHTNRERVYQLIRTFYEIVPNEQWGLIKDRPVVWLWGAYFDIKFDQSFFDYVYSEFEADFGVRPYIVGEFGWGADTVSEQPIAIDDLYIWGASLDGFRDLGVNVSEVGPGFDERGLLGPDRTARFVDREDGDFYRRNFEAAIASENPLIAIETWNEFHEANDIADSLEYGREYIDLTRELVGEFKAAAAGVQP